MEITKIVHQNEYSGFIPFDGALDFDECWELVKTHVKENNVRISGEEHQEKYLPIISLDERNQYYKKGANKTLEILARLRQERELTRN